MPTARRTPEQEELLQQARRFSTLADVASHVQPAALGAVLAGGYLGAKRLTEVIYSEKNREMYLKMEDESWSKFEAVEPNQETTERTK